MKYNEKSVVRNVRRVVVAMFPAASAYKNNTYVVLVCLNLQLSFSIECIFVLSVAIEVNTMQDHLGTYKENDKKTIKLRADAILP